VQFHIKELTISIPNSSIIVFYSILSLKKQLTKRNHKMELRR